MLVEELSYLLAFVVPDKIQKAYLGTSIRHAFSEKHNDISLEHQIDVFCSDQYLYFFYSL